VNLAQLRAQFRYLADDRAGGHQADDAQLAFWLNEAQQQACLRARLLFEEENASVCTIALIGGQRRYALHPAVLEIGRLWHVEAGGRKTRVDLASRGWLDRNMPDWHESSSAPPRFAVQDDTRLRLVGGFATGDAVQLHCWRLPLQEMVQDSDVPEIHAAHHAWLIDWALYRYYSVPDTEAIDPRREQQALARFERHFGTEPMADLKRSTRFDAPQGTVAMP